VESNTEKLILLQEKLDNHIAEYDERRKQEDDRWDHLLQCQEQNTQCMKDLTDSTKGLIEAWEAANGAVKTLSALGRFVKWLSGFAIVGGAATWTVEHFTK